MKSDTLTYNGDATVSFEIGDEKFTVYEVSGEDYTGKIDVTVNDPNAADPSVSPYRTATDADVKAAMNGTADNTVLVDARSTDSYQGWALGDAKRGGHLKNAVSYPATAVTNPVTPDKNEGTTVSDYQAQTIQDAGLTTDKKVIIYDTNDTDAKTVADALVKDHGFSADNITTYNATKLINSGKAKVVKYKNYDLYVPAEVVNNIAQNKVGKLDEYSDNAAKVVNGDDVVILDVGWGDETSDPDIGSGYDAGHVPGAIHVNTDEYETPKVYVPSKPEKYRTEWRLVSDDKLIELAENKGITKDSCVIITGYEPMATTRMGVILKYLGVENVHVMSGAMNTYSAAGYDMETGVNKATKTDLGITKPENPDVIDTISEVKKEIKNDDYVVIDTRTADEWNGKSSGYSYHDLNGRIPGTVLSECGKGYSSSVFYYRHADKTMRTANGIENMWAGQNIDKNKHLVFFCGSGWRAAETTWDAWVMGLDASLYSDGWIGWSNEGNPYIRNGKTYELNKATGKEVNISAIKAAKPTSVKAKAGSKKATIIWKKTSKATYYKVYQKSGSKYKVVKITKSSKAVVKKLKKGKTYTFKVRGYQTINGSKIYTGYGKTVKVKAK